MLRAAVFDAMRSSMMAPRIEARPSKVTISSSSRTTGKATPDWLRRKWPLAGLVFIRCPGGS